MIMVQLRRVQSQALLAAVLDVLKKHFQAGYLIHKPRASLTYTPTALRFARNLRARTD